MSEPLRMTKDEVAISEGLIVFLATSEGPIPGTVCKKNGNLFNGNKVNIVYDVPNIVLGIGTIESFAQWELDKVYGNKDIALTHNED